RDAQLHSPLGGDRRRRRTHDDGGDRDERHGHRRTARLAFTRRGDRRRARGLAGDEAARAHGGDGRVAAPPRHGPPGQRAARRVLRRGGELHGLPDPDAGRRRRNRHRGHRGHRHERHGHRRTARLSFTGGGDRRRPHHDAR